MAGREKRGSVGARTPATAAVLLAVAIGVGGGGTPAPAPEALVELAALVALAVAVASGLRPVPVTRSDPAWGTVLVAIVALPCCQLLPLPSDWWRALPGRDVEAAALDVVGAGNAWRPWSMLPDETLAAALALLPAIVLAVLVAARLPAARARLLAVLAAVATLSGLLGLLQFAAGPDRSLTLFAAAPRGVSTGVFANRNTQADLLSIALVAALLLADRHRAHWRSGPARAGLAILVGLLFAAAVTTGSRLGLLTLLVPLALAGSLVRPRARVAAAGAALLVGALLLAGGTALDRVTARVHDGGHRREIWRDAGVAARAVAPVGAGMGGFVPMFERVERLDQVQPSYVNRAHAEWLELTIEGGAPALILLAASLVFVVGRSWRAWRDSDPDRRLLARFAGLAALILAVHATVDYPLRTLALLAVAGLAIGGIARSPPEEGAGHAALG